MRIRLQDREIFYEVAGSGPPVMLLHGFGGDHTYWESQLKALSPYFRVINYDQQGNGLSSRPSHGLTMADHVRDAYELIQALGAGPTALVGFSQGGAIAMQVALTHPESVRCLVMHDASTDFARPSLVTERRQALAPMIDTLEKNGMAAFAGPFTEGNFSPGFKVKRPEVWQRYRDMIARNDARTVILNLKAGAEQDTPPFNLELIRCPVLFVMGELDSLIPADKRERAQASVKGSEMVVLKGIGHAAAAEDPEDFNRAVLDFLQRHAG
jgi:pimeloyl-ACP methyl ester carboxylesterase